MKNKNLIFIFSFFFYHSIAQIPANYYDSANLLAGSSLKSALHNIIKGHKSYEYTADTTDVWDILKQTDRDPNNPDNVIEIYTGWSVNAAQEYNSGNGWEREHVWAKVHGGFGTSPPCGTDVHHLRPIDNSVNSARNSRWFASCSTPYLVNGTPTGSFTSSAQYVWEPRPDDKGDIARMIFYMAVRYEGDNGEPNLEIVDYIPSNNNDPSPIMAKLSDLLLWNQQDTVDARERTRNDIIYYQFQHNRNPFIDHPEYANLIWGPDSSSSGLNKETAMDLIVFPNPTNNLIQIIHHKKGEKYCLVNSMGCVVLTSKFEFDTETVSLIGLKPGIYFLKVEGRENVPIKLIKL